MLKSFHLLSIACALGVLGCSAKDSDLQSTKEREMTLGVVQKEVKVGMSQADVATSLGSPNIVTKDGEGNETWIYDKIASEASYSRSITAASRRRLWNFNSFRIQQRKFEIIDQPKNSDGRFEIR